MENLAKRTRIRDASITNRGQETEERICSTEEMIEETDELVKENDEHNRFLIQNFEEFWDTMERLNLRMIVIEHRKIPRSIAQKTFLTKSWKKIPLI